MDSEPGRVGLIPGPFEQAQEGVGPVRMNGTQPVGTGLLRAVAVMDRLRSPGGCPWDAEQTHASLAPYAVEEAHELAEAAESGQADHLREELGDLLLQVLFHARIAAEAEDGFDIDDVAAALVDKLTYRHPHVFTDDGERGLSAQEVTDQWEVLKAAQQRRASVLEGIPASLPALARAQKVLSRVDKAGLVLDADTAGPDDAVSEQIGADLLDLVRAAHRQGVDAEAALRGRIRHLEEQVRRAEG
ncbi:MazG family protein [Pseudactinotalea sp. Z1732]|uniref:MazG family protein n=1 Tax=Pseudactinotalea sp. Z1732 TaxID=3413026 RepID=UPI003C7A5768